MAKDFIAKATAHHKGAFAAQAKAAGKTTAEYAKEKYHAKGTLGKRARLAYTLMGLHGDGKSSDKHAGDKRTNASRLYQVG